ncbi:nitric oxide reductase activation protein NorD [Magnetococcus marinus]|uniref:nitric oxide reductase activation protein NorD n=1 Tax=Magnetococcus marinus TaxID=1124597 RepID=UPI001D10E77C|nr:VWA domain-containing protein [Magnetococcus marinus]
MNLDPESDGMTLLPFSPQMSSAENLNIEFNRIKGFAQSYDNQARGRIQAIKPGFYTRLGAAIRQSVHLLQEQAARRHLLLILTDGKPHDVDHYDGRWGVEDTRMAVREARAQNVHPFCITIDPEANSYAPYLFGADGFVRVTDPAKLPTILPQIYLSLTA